MKLRLGEWLVLIGSALIVWLAWMVGAVIYAKPPPVQFAYSESPLTTQGEMVLRRENCLTCHEIFGNGTSYGPSLDGVGSRRQSSWLRDYLVNPRAGVGIKPYRVKMPAYDTLEAAELDALVAYLQALRELGDDGQPQHPSG